jgi:flagellar biosynthesis/type III secretory pathway protein FliH
MPEVGAGTKPGGAACRHAAEEVEALPKVEPDDERLFTLLRKAYIEARYNKAYRINLDELSALQSRVLGLAGRVREASLEKLAKQAGLREGELRGREAGLREGEARGEAKGKAEGRREGEARELRTAVPDLCEAFGLELTRERGAQIEAMGVGELEALRAVIKQHRRWPG